MARYKYIDTNPRFLAVDLAKQLLPGTIEHAVHHLFEHELDVTAVDARFRNDVAGATAYPPTMLFQVALCAYAHGIVSSRGIARACEDHVTFIALCGATTPHFTTIAHFVSTLSEDIVPVFAAVRAACDKQGLIGREMFAIDGVKLPSNASKRRSGTRAELAERATKLHGTGSEQECLVPMVTALAPLMTADTLLTADAGYHSEDNLKALAGREIDALIADGLMRERDERFATQCRHQTGPDPLHDKTPAAPTPPTLFTPSDFTYDAEARTCVCPAGESLYRKGKQLATKGHIADRFQDTKGACGPCTLRAQCLRTPEKTPTRQVAFFTGKTAERADSHTARMQRRIDTPEERVRYAQRFATVEPVFGNLRWNKRLDRFTLRGQRKVDGQWKLFSMIQNIEKLAHHGYA